MILINPVGMDLQTWADRTVQLLERFGFKTRLVGDDWQKWGLTLLATMCRVQGPLPDPRGFKDWREWAQRLIGALAP